MHDKRTVPKSSIITFATALAVCMFAIFLFTHNRADVDLWGNVGFVKHLPTSPDFHRTNTFSFTEPDHIWVNHEWLAEYILHHTHRIFGNPGLLLLKALLGFSLIGIIYHSMRKNCTSATVRIMYLLLIISTLGYGFSTRPHLFTYILIAALLSALLRIFNPTQNMPATSISPPPALHCPLSTLYILLFLSAPLGCLWANLHGAYFIGQIMLLLAFVYALIIPVAGREKSWKKTVILGTASIAFFAGTLLNPYGINLWGFIFDSAAIFRPILSEWAPFNPIVHFSDHVDFIVLVAITVIGVLVSFRSCSGFGLIILLLTLVAAFSMRRNIPLFAIVAGLVATGAIGKSFSNEIDNIMRKFNRQLITALLFSATAISALFFINANRESPLGIIVPRDQFPIEAVAFLERNKVQANAIVFFDWAELCIWRIFPNCRVFLDGRFKSAYSEKAISTYLNFIYAKGDKLAALNDYPTDLVFVHVNNPCTAIMHGLDGWEVVYEDNMAIIFVKRSAHEKLLRKLAMKSAYLPGSNLNNLFP